MLPKLSSWILITVTLLFAGQAVACTCVGRPGTISEEYELSDAVFMGTVLSTAITTDTNNLVAFIELAGAWKGDLPAYIFVVTGPSSGECGVMFMPGESWVVFGTDTMYEGNAAVFTHICTLARQEEYAAAIIAELGPVTIDDSTWGRVKAIYR